MTSSFENLSNASKKQNSRARKNNSFQNSVSEDFDYEFSASANSSKNLADQIVCSSSLGHSFTKISAASPSVSIVQMKRNQPLPIQKQGYGVEDENKMMSVWHDDSAGMSSPDAPMSFPTPVRKSRSHKKNYRPTKSVKPVKNKKEDWLDNTWNSTTDFLGMISDEAPGLISGWKDSLNSKVDDAQRGMMKKERHRLNHLKDPSINEKSDVDVLDFLSQAGSGWLQSNISTITDTTSALLSIDKTAKGLKQVGSDTFSGDLSWTEGLFAPYEKAWDEGRYGEILGRGLADTYGFWPKAARQAATKATAKVTAKATAKATARKAAKAPTEYVKPQHLDNLFHLQNELPIQYPLVRSPATTDFIDELMSTSPAANPVDFTNLETVAKTTHYGKETGKKLLETVGNSTGSEQQNKKKDKN